MLIEWIQRSRLSAHIAETHYLIRFLPDGRVALAPTNTSMPILAEHQATVAQALLLDAATADDRAQLDATLLLGQPEAWVCGTGIVLMLHEPGSCCARVLDVAQEDDLSLYVLPKSRQDLARAALMPEARRLAPGTISQVMHAHGGSAHQRMALRVGIPDLPDLEKAFPTRPGLFLHRVRDVAVLMTTRNVLLTMRIT